MNPTPVSETVWFSPKGQVLIPRRMRKELHIEEGTRAIATITEEGILLKPVTRHSINRLRGILRRKPGDKPFAQEWADHKREELALEERKHGRITGA
ncbi:MAG: AbrB/MazE/SpoVT family DNA-binding domain-containing protein [Opitutaceae bacterium]|nr:AbrB/MazE/SpoVT family DNA-binding domain-containing protein [Opitutaceae bacterium]